MAAGGGGAGSAEPDLPPLPPTAATAAVTAASAAASPGPGMAAQPANGLPRKPDLIARVKFAYAAQGAQELTLAIGQHLRFVGPGG